MRLTLRTNLAMRVLMHCAVNAGRTVRKHEIALACNASENHLAQVIHHLAQAGYIDTQRGRAGGLRLNRRAEEIKVGAVFRLFEAGTPFAECFDGAENTCPLTRACLLRPALLEALEAFYRSLDSVTLAQLVEDNSALAQLLALGAPRAACGGPAPLPLTAA